MPRRSWDLRLSPPVYGQIQHGRTKQKKSGYNHPEKLEYFRVAKRQKDKGSPNYERLDAVHEAIGDEPKRVPIRLLSDDIYDSFCLHRAAFDEGSVMCSAPYEQSNDEKMHDVPFVVKGDDEKSYIPRDKYEAMKRGDIEGRAIKEKDDGVVAVGPDGTEYPIVFETTNRATRFFRGKGKQSDPYNYPCSPACTLFQNGTCELSGHLYFQLDHPDFPSHLKGALFQYKTSGIYGLRSLRSSLKRILHMTDGVLAGLPLNIRYHQEKKQVQDGNHYNIPMPTIEPRCGHDKFFEHVRNELDQRRALYKKRQNSEPASFDDIKRQSELDEIHRRGTTMPDTIEADKEAEEHEEVGFPDDIETIFDNYDVPPKRREVLFNKHEGNPERIEASLKEDDDGEIDTLFEDLDE